MKKREERRQKIHEWRFEKQFNTPSSSPFNSPAVLHALPLQEKMLLDSRSVYVGNVDYSATPDQLEEHFHGCGAIERVTIAKDKFSACFGFAYIQFTEADGMRNAISMTESLFLGRQIKVTEKRTNRPGISTTNRPPRRGKTQMIMKYILPGRGMMGGRPRRHGFSPY
ncbi:RNA recognition motif domain-containing protein [Ditylenchus destructor]|uniref:RNA recognition motif domain-containing protein n=1 Tax=Ditylenchus destructor TaxID=166010 RepID=A0AAD4MMJ9_9BILA|nr:RNA recognition motif domain-containing protein [Ditylenchus destructor]